MRSFFKWFENNGQIISTIGLAPLIIPMAIMIFGDLAFHGWIKSPFFLVNFLLNCRDNQEFLFFVYSIGFSMVIFGQLANYNKATRKKDSA